MNHFTIYQGIIVMDDCYWFKIKELALLNRDSFDIEIRNFIQLIKNSNNLLDPLIIELPLLSCSNRHKLHTFERKNKVIYYSIGNNNKDNFRKMRVNCSKDYINELKLDTVVSIPQIPETNKNSRTKIIDHLTSIKDLINQIITEIN